MLYLSKDIINQSSMLKNLYHQHLFLASVSRAYFRISILLTILPPGNEHLLKTLSEVWKSLVLYCQSKDCILRSDQFPQSTPLPGDGPKKQLPSASKNSSSIVAKQRPLTPPPVRQPAPSTTPRKKGKRGKGKK